MTSTGDGGAGAVDPDFAGLFRPDDVPPSPRSAPSTPAPPATPADPSDEPEPSPGPPPAQTTSPEPSVDTGRLFRSQGVVGREDAVLALASDHGGRLRTLERAGETPGHVPGAGPDAEQAAPAGVPLPASAEPGVAPAVDAAPIVVADHGSDGAPFVDMGEHAGRARRRGISAGAVYLIVLGVTLLVGFADALLFGGVGWLTGAALLVASVYAALTVRRDDDLVAVITPPIAMLLVALTAGQLNLGAVEGTVLNRAVVTFFTLADNWAWTIAATVAALVIVLVRRRRA